MSAAPIVTRQAVRCSAVHAFRCFTERIDAWWPPGHRAFSDSTLRLEGLVGGRFLEESAAGELRELGVIQRWDPPGRLSYTWNPGAGVGPTWVDVEFTEEHGVTMVVATHREGESEFGEAWPVRAQVFQRAWSHLLPIFAVFAEPPGAAEFKKNPAGASIDGPSGEGEGHE